MCRGETMKKLLILLLASTLMFASCETDKSNKDEVVLETTDVEGKLAAIQDYQAIYGSGEEEINAFVEKMEGLGYIASETDSYGDEPNYEFIKPTVEGENFTAYASTFGSFTYSEKVSDSTIILLTLYHGHSEYGEIAVAIIDNTNTSGVTLKYYPGSGEFAICNSNQEEMSYEELTEEEKSLYDSNLASALEVFESALDELASFTN